MIIYFSLKKNFNKNSVCGSIIKKVTYDLTCDTRLIISFGTVVKIIFTRCDYLISLGTYFTHAHTIACVRDVFARV